MYARHLGWLNATPEGAKQSRREELSKGGEGSPFLQLPDLEEASYIIAYWHDAGTVNVGGMGVAPLSWSEIRAWRLENELQLDNFEINSIRRLSIEYCGEYNAASEKGREAPYTISEESFDRSAMSNKIGSLLSGFKKGAADEAKWVVED